MGEWLSQVSPSFVESIFGIAYSSLGGTSEVFFASQRIGFIFLGDNIFLRLAGYFFLKMLSRQRCWQNTPHPPNNDSPRERLVNSTTLKSYSYSCWNVRNKYYILGLKPNKPVPKCVLCTFSKCDAQMYDIKDRGTCNYVKIYILFHCNMLRNGIYAIFSILLLNWPTLQPYFV